MTIQVNEIPESKAERRGQGEPYTAERTFIAYDDAGAAFSLRLAIIHPNMPRFGQAHPDQPALKAKRYRANTRRGKTSYIYEVTWEYETVEAPGIPPDTDDPDEPLSFVEQEVEVETIWIDAWRTELSGLYLDNGDAAHYVHLYAPSQDSNGEPAFHAAQRVAKYYNRDIGGLPIDSAGIPTSIAHVVLRLSIRHFRLGPIVPYISLLTFIIGKRNRLVYANFATGSLLYKGARATRVGINVWEITHEFVGDELRHWRQLNWIDTSTSDRQPQLWENALQKFADDPDAPDAGEQNHITFQDNSDASGADDYDGSGWPVRWIQPYPRTVDFNLLQIPTF